MLEYRTKSISDNSAKPNNIDGFTRSSYTPRPIITGRNTVTANVSPEPKASASLTKSSNDKIISGASESARALLEPRQVQDTKDRILSSSAPTSALPFGLAVQPSTKPGISQPVTLSDKTQVKTKKRFSLSLKNRPFKSKKFIKNLFKPPWMKLKNWDEFKIFSAGATLAAGLIVLGFYLGFNRPLGLAESDPVTTSGPSEVLTEEVLKDEPVVAETSDGQKVEVSQGINPNEVDRRPPAPVQPNLPVRMRIPSINVNAPIRSVGLLPDKTLAVPNFVYQVGWYDQSAKPGEPGTVLMDGHYGVTGAWGVFSRLKEVSKGTEIEVVRGDGQVITYVVEDRVIYDRKSTPMDKAFASDDKQRLSIVTCDGEYLKNERTYTNRLIVYAVRK